MKMATLIRMNAIAIGLGAALMFTASVKAQEITNTDWPNPNAVAFDQKATSASAGQSSSVAPVQVASVPAKATAESAAVSKAEISRGGSVLIGSLAICAGLVMYALPRRKRDRKRWDARAGELSDEGALS